MCIAKVEVCTGVSIYLTGDTEIVQASRQCWGGDGIGFSIEVRENLSVSFQVKLTKAPINVAASCI